MYTDISELMGQQVVFGSNHSILEGSARTHSSMKMVVASVFHRPSYCDLGMMSPLK